MNERTEQRKRQPLIHGRMIYRCEQCGNSWPMYLEKGIEEFGENHKPSPFMIVCPFCEEWAMDVSGIQKVPGGGYVPLPDGYSYFANVEGKDYGVPTFPTKDLEAGKAAGKAVEIIIADEIDGLVRKVREREMTLAMACIAGYEGDDAWEITKNARAMAEKLGWTIEEAAGAIMKVLQDAGDFLAEPERAKVKPSDHLEKPDAWDREEEKEIRRAQDRESASRFRQYRAGENRRAVKKRTGARRREWRGPWKER